MEKKLLSIASIAALLGLLIVFFQTNAFASTQVGGQSNGYSCDGNLANNWKTTNEGENTVTLPSGYTIATIDVKAGNGCTPVYPTNSASTCYSVTVSGNTATVTKIGTGSSCKDISHLEGTYTVNSTPTPTPTTSVTATPTPTTTLDCDGDTDGSNPNNDDVCTTPTPTITLDCDGDTDGSHPDKDDDCTTPTPTMTVTPTPTTDPCANNGCVTPTPTPTTTTNGGGGDGRSDGLSSCPSCTQAPQGSTQAVLAASTMASTGTFEENAMNTLALVGIILMSSAYAKKAKNALFN